MQVLVDNGGSVLAQDGDRLLFLRRRIVPRWLAFVLGLVAVIGAANAVVQLALGNAVAAVALLALGAAAGAGLAAVLARRRRSLAEPLSAGGAVAVVDLAARAVLDGAGHALAPLDQVRVETAMQLTSSSRALRLSWPGGSRVVFRGDPFAIGGDHLGAAAAALAERGVGAG